MTSPSFDQVASPARGTAPIKRSRETTASRSRASLACHSCRQRKVRVSGNRRFYVVLWGRRERLTIFKCDIQAVSTGSSCTPCLNSNVGCLINKFSDRRKYITYSFQDSCQTDELVPRHGSREHIATLQDQIRSLEDLVRQNISASAASAGDSQPRRPELHGAQSTITIANQQDHARKEPLTSNAFGPPPACSSETRDPSSIYNEYADQSRHPQMQLPAFPTLQYVYLICYSYRYLESSF